MSESTTDAAAAAAAVQADADAAAAAAQTEQGTEGATATAEETAAAEAAAAEAAAAAAAEAAKKPTRQERHVANLTRKAAEETRAREAAERRAEAAEALLAAGKTEDGDKPPMPRPGAEPDRETLRAEIRFNDRLGEIDAAGKKELGADQWEAAKATLTGLGAVRNQNFLQALAETDNAAKIFAHLADDTDALVELLGKPPAAMAARLGRLDAGFAKPAPKALSGAPRPAAKVEGSGTAPQPSLHDPKLSDAEFTREAQKLMPHLFGGKRKTA
jgi:hypothetical protein